MYLNGRSEPVEALFSHSSQPGLCLMDWYPRCRICIDDLILESLSADVESRLAASIEPERSSRNVRPRV